MLDLSSSVALHSLHVLSRVFDISEVSLSGRLLRGVGVVLVPLVMRFLRGTALDLASFFTGYDSVVKLILLVL